MGDLLPIGYILETDEGVVVVADDRSLLRCDGHLVSRKKYPELYRIFGHMFSDEDARCCTSELFNLPDYPQDKT